MKRARNKRFNRKNNIEEETLQRYTAQEDSSAYAADDSEPNDFALPDEVFSSGHQGAGGEPVHTDFENTASETEPDNFAVTDNAFAADTTSEPSDFENTAEEEIPFAAGAFAGDIIQQEPGAEKPQQVHHSEDYLKRKAMNKKKFEQKRKRKRVRTVCIGVLLLLVVTATVILGLDFSGGDGEGFTTPVDTQTGKLNILLLGVDKDGERSDSIMLVSYDFDDHSINLLSVPRDTKMYVTDRAVTRKITEVHGMHNSAGKMYGAAAVAESVTSLTGIPINYYLEFSFDALDNVMDILGPVTFDVPDIEGGGKGMNYDDGYQDLHIHLKPGVQELSGNQIQQFLRYRKSNRGTTDGSDISRVGRQQELLKAIIDQKVNLELIIKIPDIFKEMKTQLKTNFGLKDVIKYAGYLKDISSENMNTYVLPGESAKTSGAWYYLCDMNATADLISTTFGYPVTVNQLTNEISLTGKKTSGKTTQSSETKKNDTSNSGKTSSNKDSQGSSSKKSSSGTSSKNTQDSNTPKNTSTSQTESAPKKNDTTSSGKNNEEPKHTTTDSATETTPKHEDKTTTETETPKPSESSDNDDETISLD